MSLSALGPRICILGPSNSGKSTLATAIATKLGYGAIHLDQLFHRPNTDWISRPAEECNVLHADAISAESWVIEGNYTLLLPARLVRGTGFILLDVSTVTSLFRYARRSCFERDRRGALEGNKDSLKWDMIRHILFATRKNRARYKRLFAQIPQPRITLLSRREIAAFYRTEGLQR